MGLLVSDVMTRRVKRVRRDDSVEEARRLILANDNKAILVFEEENIIGIVSRTDIIKRYNQDACVEDIMSPDVFTISEGHTVQEAAKCLTEKAITSIPVLDKDGKVIGLISTQDVIKDIVKDNEDEDSLMSLEVMTIHLAMTKNRELEEYWIQKAYENGFKAVITQVGANAEKLAIKMRESAIVAAIAKGVISESQREKIAVSNAVRDVYAQLNLINPGLGGGFKMAIAVGSGMVTVSAFGRSGHALANGPEQIVIGYSII